MQSNYIACAANAYKRKQTQLNWLPRAAPCVTFTRLVIKVAKWLGSCFHVGSFISHHTRNIAITIDSHRMLPDRSISLGHPYGLGATAKQKIYPRYTGDASVQGPVGGQ